ncbi:MAG: uracil-DNA glycosylase [Planctomycetia bacterium]|nr:uracil-DNA glycosylase [Planctomycetia bacterium]
MPDQTPSELTRALRQELEGWRRAGLSHLPIAPRKRTAAATKPPATRSAAVGSPSARPAAAVSSRTATVASSTNVMTKTATPPAVAAASPSPKSSTASIAHALPVLAAAMVPSPHPAGSVEDREWRLDQLKQRVAQCVRCQELASTRTQTVFGVGSSIARIMFIGEAPGADEDAEGIPFVGKAGQLMDKIIAAAGLKREELYICNILRCRPPGNRKPQPTEAANCREYLDGQIAVINPEYIICWGATAAQNLLATEDAIGRLRGRFFQHGSAKVLCTYHPSYLLRNPSAKKDVWEDIKIFLKEAGLPLPE